MAGTQLLEQWKTKLENYKLSWGETGLTWLCEQENNGADSRVAGILCECIAV